MNIFCDSESGRWAVVNTKGASLTGMYGHTAVWDKTTSLVYVHGGLVSVSATSQVVPVLLTYDPHSHVW